MLEALGPPRSGQPQNSASKPADLTLDLGSGAPWVHSFFPLPLSFFIGKMGSTTGTAVRIRGAEMHSV